MQRCNPVVKCMQITAYHIANYNPPSCKLQCCISELQGYTRTVGKLHCKLKMRACNLQDDGVAIYKMCGCNLHAFYNVITRSMYIGIEVTWHILIETISIDSSNHYDVSQTHQAMGATKTKPKAVQQMETASAMGSFVAGLRKKQQEYIGVKAASEEEYSEDGYSEEESEAEATSKRPAGKTPAAADPADTNRKDRNKYTAWKRFQREGELDEETLGAFLKANKAGQRDIVNQAVVKPADGSY